MKFLPFLNWGDKRNGKRAAPSTRKPKDNPLQALSHMIGGLYSSNYSNYKTTLEAMSALENHIVFQCVEKIAIAVKSVDWYAAIDEDALAKGVTAPSKEVLNNYNRLLKNPCGLSGAQLRYWLAQKIALEGRAVLKTGIYNGKANAIYPLPGLVQVSTDSYGNKIAYEFGDTTPKAKLPSRDKATDGNSDDKGYINDSFAFEISKPRITLDSGTGNSPLPAIVMPTEITKLLLQRAYDMADGTPNLKHILWSPDALSQADNDLLEETIEDKQIGTEENTGYAIIQGINLNHIAIDDNLGDLHTKVPADDMARRIAGAFGVPPALLNLAGSDGAKFANNYIESRLSFFEDTIIPGYIVPIEDAFTTNICAPGIKICFDCDTIPALREKRIKALVDISKAGFLSTEEKRELAGFPKSLEPQQT